MASLPMMPMMAAARKVGRLSSGKVTKLLSTLSLLSNDDNYDKDYYRCEANQSQIIKNIRLRQMTDNFKDIFDDKTLSDRRLLGSAIMRNMESMPNKLDPIWYARLEGADSGSEADHHVVETVGTEPQLDFSARKAETLLQKLGLLYLSDRSGGDLGVVAGKNSYALVADLARLERALVRWTTKSLINEWAFESVVVPQLLYSDIIKSCGFNPSGHRSQVYRLVADRRVCLVGTAEQSLAALHIGETFAEEDLPRKYCSVSRCYRAEGKGSKQNWGLYRVHSFTKVEMFAITREEQSSQMLDHLLDIQKSLFTSLGLYFRVIDMPPHDLGLPAYRKFDIEAYMPGRNTWGEISSASNCTDFQSRRLNVKYRSLRADEQTNQVFAERFAHTVNATACAVPRMLISICEQNQTEDGSVVIPEVLRPYMDGQSRIDKRQTLFAVVDDPNTGQVVSL